jgi:hypothetical protein
VASIAREDASEHVAWLPGFNALDRPTSSALTTLPNFIRVTE